ncbi:MAG TPA: hypothetical protein DEQ45_18755 [Agrobacterium sp.]|nr:hypothetical protein CFBP6625_19435 [Agrobacterium tumefaciens]HCD85835.1 hypothetical protein [Agrobacterium sp.]
MPSNNTPFDLVYNPVEITVAAVEKPRQFSAQANIAAFTNNAMAPGNDPCFLFLHCTKSE